MQIVKKLTIKTCGNFTQARIREVLQAVVGTQIIDGVETLKPVPDGTAVELLRIAGSVLNAQSGSTDKGSYTKLLGEFVGIDTTTGEVYQSDACIMPEFIGEQVGAAVLGANGSRVEFGFVIGAQAMANSVTGYKFTVKSLVELHRNDTQARLLALAQGKTLPQLAAPAADQTPAPAADPALADQTPALAPADTKKARAK